MQFFTRFMFFLVKYFIVAAAYTQILGLERTEQHPTTNAGTYCSDSIICSDWDNTSNTWINNSKEIISCYPDGKIKTSINQEWNGNVWVNISKTDYVYNSDGKVTEKKSFTWTGSSWNNSTREIFIFDTGTGLLLSYQSELGNGNGWINSFLTQFSYNGSKQLIVQVDRKWISNSWTNFSKDTLIYSGNNVAEFINQIWIDSLSSWQNFFKRSRTYSGNNPVEDVFQYWKNNIWENNSKRISQYDINSNRTNFEVSFWDGNLWKVNYQYQYQYDQSNNLISEQYQTWNGSAWQNIYLDAYEYDSLNNQTLYLSQEWSNNAWVNYYKNEMLYNSLGFADSSLSHYWVNNDWESSELCKFYYAPLSINSLNESKSLFEFYPNPATDKITFITSNRENISLHIINIQGSKVGQYYITNGDEINLSHFSKGLYFIIPYKNDFLWDEPKKLIVY
jgi:hypothetical protein